MTVAEFPPGYEEPAKDKGKSRTEGEIAGQFVLENARTLKFNEQEGCWCLWDGAIWRRTRKSLGVDLAHRMANAFAPGSANRKEVLSARFAKGIVELVKANSEIARADGDFDADNDVAGAPTGTLILADMTVAPADPARLISRSLAVAPEDFEDCPRWQEFLLETTGGDEDVVKFLARWCGYCLSGSVKEHTLLFIYGSGGNGKSVFVNTIAGIMADYAVTAPMETFSARPFENHSTDLAMLRGARLVTASETEEGRHWNEALVKQLTGGDKITARFMRQDNFEYRPQFKLMIVGNHKPSIKQVDDAIRRRLCIIPFDCKPKSIDTDLEEKLRAEWPGILRWACNGYLDWQRRGLARPEAVLAATEEYLADQDMLGQWIEEACRSDIGNPYVYERSGALFEAWNKWSRTRGEDPRSIKVFVSALQKLGYRKVRRAEGFRFEGLALNAKAGDGYE